MRPESKLDSRGGAGSLESLHGRRTEKIVSRSRCSGVTVRFNGLSSSLASSSISSSSTIVYGDSTILVSLFQRRFSSRYASALKSTHCPSSSDSSIAAGSRGSRGRSASRFISRHIDRFGSSSHLEEHQSASCREADRLAKDSTRLELWAAAGSTVKTVVTGCPLIT